MVEADSQAAGLIRTTWNTACKKAGIPGAWFHELRRAAVSTMERAGVSASVAMKVTGHKTESIYKRNSTRSQTEPAMEEGLGKLARLAASDINAAGAQEA